MQRKGVGRSTAVEQINKNLSYEKTYQKKSYELLFSAVGEDKNERTINFF